MMIAQVCDLEAGEFIHTFGTHIYNNTEQLKLQLSREPKPLPKNDFEPNIYNFNLILMILR
jgi:thymidylate synthase